MSPVDHRPDLRIGLDVGGTNTDAVVLDQFNTVLAKVKFPTSGNVTDGIKGALDAVLSGHTVDPSRVTHLMLGTTHATNAVVERKRLLKVAVIRIGGTATSAVRPLFGWPQDLKDALCAGTVIVDGGREFDGREIDPLDTDAVAAFLRSVRLTAEAVAITSVFAPVSPDHELAAQDLVRSILGPDVPVSLSHDIGQLGIIERENSTVLNAALNGVANEVASALRSALSSRGLSPAVLFAQNDGTLMGLEYAVRYPVLTIGSGPANSLRGAAFLTGLTDAMVADVGGTTTDIGVLVGGFPRESSLPVEIGGIRTNFRMPDIVSIGVGGGTIVHPADGDAPRVGPDSVGYRLPQEAISFGGSTPTLTDAAVVAGRASIGHVGVPDELHKMLSMGLELADEMVAVGVDQMKVGRAELPLIVVGGGSVLLPDHIPGVSEVLRPNNFDVANAIGAAIAQVSGRWDEVIKLDGNRLAAIEAAGQKAKDRAVAAGADADLVTVVDIDEIPLAYLTEPAARISVKAVGPLSWL